MMKLRSRLFSARHAFSLIELSIVLVIVGLLAGSIVVGEKLIHAAELRAVASEFHNYQEAIATFKQKYNALPGDMPNATSLWGSDSGGAIVVGTDANCKDFYYSGVFPTAPTRATCNGNGNGMIDVGGAGMVAVAGPVGGGGNKEGYRFWQHLANAGMVAGGYTGRGTGDSAKYASIAVVGQNAGISAIRQAGWSVQGFHPFQPGFYEPTLYGMYKIDYRTALFFGAPRLETDEDGYDYLGSSILWTDDPIMPAEDAYNIDRKLDDGLPNTGIVSTYRHTKQSELTDYRPHCANATEDAYMLDDTTKGCMLIFLTGL
jgi:prepilin-type N-terminal cleavage/methylation domain-containing protein